MNDETALVAFTPEQAKVLKSTIAKNLTDSELLFFLEACKAMNLNPFQRQMYAVKYTPNSPLTIQMGIDGYRVIAERTGKYKGQLGPLFCAADGVWRDAWLTDDMPVAAKVGIIRSDFTEPVWAVARYKSYAQSSNALWTKAPDVMLAKCAESLALRKAFPSQLSGAYTHDEMDQAQAPESYTSIVHEAVPAAISASTPAIAAPTTPTIGNGAITHIAQQIKMVLEALPFPVTADTVKAYLKHHPLADIKAWEAFLFDIHNYNQPLLDLLKMQIAANSEGAFTESVYQECLEVYSISFADIPQETLLLLQNAQRFCDHALGPVTA